MENQSHSIFAFGNDRRADWVSRVPCKLQVAGKEEVVLWSCPDGENMCYERLRFPTSLVETNAENSSVIGLLPYRTGSDRLQEQFDDIL